MVLTLICVVWGLSVTVFTGIGVWSFFDTKKPKDILLGFLAGVMLPPVAVAELIVIVAAAIFFVVLIVFADASSRVVTALRI